MGIASTLIGGTVGFLVFFVAWLGFAAQPLVAFGLYIGTGAITTCVMLAFGLFRQTKAAGQEARRKKKSDMFAEWDQDQLTDRLMAELSSGRSDDDGRDAGSKVA